jgi:hypothetical protein
MSLSSIRKFEGIKHSFLIGLCAIAVVAFPLVLSLVNRGAGVLPSAFVSDRKQEVQVVSHTYTTTFPIIEAPISEGGNWTNGKAVGLNWADVRTTPGLAFGTESGNNGYDDSAALLTGNWGPDQTAEAAVHTVNQNDNIYEEVELRLRSTLSARSATGYEINFRCSKTANAYTQIVRWNGPLGNFTYIAAKQGRQYGVANGDVVKATIKGHVITAYINGVQVLQATDKKFTTGSPGIGFFLQKAAGVNNDFGFTRFTASDSPAPSPLSDIVH